MAECAEDPGKFSDAERLKLLDWERDLRARSPLIGEVRTSPHYARSTKSCLGSAALVPPLIWAELWENVPALTIVSSAIS